MIQVLIVDNSSADIDALIAIFSADREIEVIGVATKGKQAIDLVSKLHPDIVTISESLQSVDALEAVKQIMAYNPTPILMLADPNSDNRNDNILKALVKTKKRKGFLELKEMPVPEINHKV